MSEKNDAPILPPLLDRFEQDLADAKEKEDAAKLQVTVAKELLSLARGDRKRLAKAIEIYTGSRSPSLTKKSIVPIVNHLLSGGPLSGVEVKNGVESELKAKKIARTGLGLILGSLAPIFESDGVWSLNLEQGGPPESEQDSKN